MPEDFSLGPIVERLERLFRELRMARHAAKLATFKRGYQAQRARLAKLSDAPWTSETVLELARVFTVPVPEGYPIVSDDARARCPTCSAEVRSAPCVTVYADRSLYACRGCGARFLRLLRERQGM